MRPSLVLVLAILLLPTQAFPQQTLLLGKPDDPETDISSRVLVEAYSRLGIEIKLLELPAQRSLTESDAGRQDGEVNRIMEVEQVYTNLIRIPVAVNIFEAMVFSRHHRFLIGGIESLKSFTLAIRIGSKYAENLTEGLDVAKFPSYEKIFALLSQDRYDIVIATRLNGLREIKKQKLRGIVALEPPLAVYRLYHYLHKKNGQLVPKITRVLEEMEAEGMIDQIRNHYIDELLKPG